MENGSIPKLLVQMLYFMLNPYFLSGSLEFKCQAEATYMTSFQYKL